MIRTNAFCIVIALLASGGTAPARAQGADSLRRELLRLAVREAEAEAERTGFWRRLMPRIEFSAGFSAGNLLFADPATGGALLLPRDSYRISFGVPISNLYDRSAHEKALLMLEQARAELRLAAALADELAAAARARAEKLDSLRLIEREERTLREEIVQYQTLLFGQGKCSFDALARAKLSLLAARSAAILRGFKSASLGEEP